MTSQTWLPDHPHQQVRSLTQEYILALENPNGRPIGSNLSLFDLFSFDVPGNSRLRLNLESLFHKYEGYIEAHTRSLIAKLNTRSGDLTHPLIPS
jgi:hypothetical protein